MAPVSPNPLMKESFQMPRAVYDGDDLYRLRFPAVRNYNIGVNRPETVTGVGQVLHALAA
jgi:hypothetical protein